MQELFRKGFKKAGARVLLTSDPGRALGRLRQDAKIADCLVVNAELIGLSALEMFNELPNSHETAQLPALLLLGENQKKWARQAKISPHRRVAAMPITMKQLRDTLLELLPKKKEDELTPE